MTKYVVLYFDAADRSSTKLFDTYEEAEEYCETENQYGVDLTICEVLKHYHDGNEVSLKADENTLDDIHDYTEFPEAKKPTEEEKEDLTESYMTPPVLGNPEITDKKLDDMTMAFAQALGLDNIE